MTKAATLLAMLCMLIAGTAAATILTRESVPPAGVSLADTATLIPVSNREAKTDKLLAAAAEDDTTGSAADTNATDEAAPAPDAPTQASADEPVEVPTKPIQLAYAATDDAGAAIPMPEPRAKAAEPATKLPPVIATAPVQKPKPAKPKPPALLSDAQISQLKGRLNLSSSQEYYWPSVEQALRAIGRKLQASRYVAENGPPPIDPDSSEVQQLKYAAMPLLFQMREDQKQEVRKLARAMGLEQVAQAI
ncbi:hypothetical protein [Rhodopseudomonas palustris]|uniref:Uncharacterized protein n=1 Tax=Rhodopseudomonas palustris TaxID=1076 RepID=A0A418UY86_RHOPL|nr:hypothetical protein [Rhodopseudomonas palustris]RJF67419.1 hypothetical protein D4Q52_23340 [Rhodopseudomonas palustris]